VNRWHRPQVAPGPGRSPPERRGIHVLRDAGAPRSVCGAPRGAV